MKRFLTVIALCVMTFWSSHTSMARGFGITGGASFISINDINVESVVGYHAGITYKFDLPFGFAIQPSLLYHMKGSMIKDAVDTRSYLDMKAGYLELPLSVQWGPDLILFRPFLDVTPFIGYGLNNNFSGYSSTWEAIRDIKNQWDGMNRLEYGLGLGVGLDVWKIQIIGRYNWNFGSLFDSSSRLPSMDNVFDTVRSSILIGKNFGGFTITASLMF